MLPRAHLILPIGISFFSFQLISYLVDRMRGNAPLYPFRPFALFVLVFPHVIAGPIVRHNEKLGAEFALRPAPRGGCGAGIGAGLVIFTVGFGKKVLLADRLAPVVDQLFSQATQRVLDFGEAWTAALAFSFQLFLDFSAYTEMAIGVGAAVRSRAAGELPPAVSRNRPARFLAPLAHFRRPVKLPARLSLHSARRQSAWGQSRYVLATIVTMGLCGLWHGAGWTYVAWGLWHGIGLIGVPRVGAGAGQADRCRPSRAGSVTMLFVLVGWVVFRANGFASAGSILCFALGGLNGLGGVLAEAKLMAHIRGARQCGLIPSAHEMKDRLAAADAGCRGRHRGCSLLSACLRSAKGAPVNFIYFQF